MLEKWNSGRIWQFDNLAIRQWKNGVMEKWNDGIVADWNVEALAKIPLWRENVEAFAEMPVWRERKFGKINGSKPTSPPVSVRFTFIDGF